MQKDDPHNHNFLNYVLLYQKNNKMFMPKDSAKNDNFVS